MHSVALGPLSLSSYSLSVAVALAGGLGMLWRLARDRGLDAGLALDAALVGLLVGLLAARVETVLTNLEYFRERPALILSLGRGGFGFRSLTVVGVAAYSLVVRHRARRWQLYLSVLTPALALGAAALWAGALFWGGFAGVPWSGPGALALPDRYGIIVPRLPLQATMAVAHSGFAVAALTVLRRALPAGPCLSLWGASTSALAAFLANFRAEQALMLGLLPRSLVADLALSAAWLIAALLLFGQRGSTPASTEPDGGPAV
ncbi:MAG: hypothetical protein HPY83_14365 [Anaerolineae bacterium]|nr:hypothetical protein [Anaerolineae bacterium]